MKQLILLYWGCAFLMYLSQVYYPVPCLLEHHSHRSFMKRNTDLFMGIAIFWLTCFFFLRTSYNDTGTYIFFWENAPTVKDFIADGGLTDLTDNPLSILWQTFSHQYIGNYHVYFLLPSILINFAVIKLLKSYSVSPVFSTIIYFSVGTCILYMAAMKQCFAMFFLLLSIPYAEKKQYVRFYLLVFIAILFHTHAFMFALLPFLFGKPWNKVTWAGLFVALFVMATYNTTMTAFMNLAQSIGALVADIEVFDGHQINVLRVIIYWIPTALALFFRERLFQDSTRMENLFVNMSIVSSMILMLGLVQGANLYARMAGYFEIAMAISLPWMLKKLFTEQSFKMVSAIATVLYFGYFLYEFGISKFFDEQYRAITLWEFISELFA